MRKLVSKAQNKSQKIYMKIITIIQHEMSAQNMFGDLEFDLNILK